MVTAIDRYLADKEYKHSIIRDREFKSSKQGLERSAIVKVTGHQNEKSLDDYDEGDESEQRQLSHTISHGTNINS